MQEDVAVKIELETLFPLAVHSIEGEWSGRVGRKRGKDR